MLLMLLESENFETTDIPTFITLALLVSEVLKYMLKWTTKNVHVWFERFLLIVATWSLIQVWILVSDRF